MTGSPGDRESTRRRVLATAGTAALGATAGCVTTSPTVRAELSGSAVFESVSASESWARHLLDAAVKLRPQATRELGVRTLTVTAPSGSNVWRGSVAAGQTSVSHVQFPVDGTSLLSAVDYGGKYVEGVEVTVTGNAFP